MVPIHHFMVNVGRASAQFSQDEGNRLDVHPACSGPLCEGRHPPHLSCPMHNLMPLGGVGGGLSIHLPQR